MIFKKKKRMVDVRELQKRGVVRIPKEDIEIPTNKEGFIEFGTTKSTLPKKSRQTEFFGSMDTSSTDSFSTESDGYNKRQVDQKITDLDNKIYKLEQRVELLERKVGVNQSNTSVGPMGW